MAQYSSVLVTGCFYFSLWSSKSRDVVYRHVLWVSFFFFFWGAEAYSHPSESTGFKSHFEGRHYCEVSHYFGAHLTQQYHLKVYLNQMYSFSVKQCATFKQQRSSGKGDNMAWGSGVLHPISRVSLVLSLILFVV